MFPYQPMTRHELGRGLRPHGWVAVALLMILLGLSLAA
jgi:hypothetical protein